MEATQGNARRGERNVKQETCTELKCKDERSAQLEERIFVFFPENATANKRHVSETMERSAVLLELYKTFISFMKEFERVTALLLNVTLTFAVNPPPVKLALERIRKAFHGLPPPHTSLGSEDAVARIWV